MVTEIKKRKKGLLFNEFTVLPGGGDINPAIYGKKPHRSTHFHEATDKQHIQWYLDAIKKGKPIFGICRGHQLVAALNGLPLIQDTSHSGGHDIIAKNLETNIYDVSFWTNSCHHQMVWVNNELKTEEYEVLGFTSKLSKRFHGENDDEYKDCIIEPEIMVWPKLRAITTQFHPEWMSGERYEDCLNYLEQVIDKYSIL